jgi:predicted ATPase
VCGRSGVGDGLPPLKVPASLEDDDSDEARFLARPERAWEAACVSASASDRIDGAGDGHARAQREVQRRAAFRRRRLVGRDGEIADLTKVVASTPLTTVTGPGGVGKTAIALAVAAASEERFPDGVFVVWLASLRSADHISSEVAAQVGMPRSGGEAYEDALIHWLAERDVLLVLDNCEHLVSAVADLVEELTARLPRLHLLATSREPLWVVDELSYRLAPLPVAGREATRAEIDASPAVRLFRERAGARTQVSLDTDDAGRLLGEICRRVDGLPLAIELAAARVAGLDLEDIERHLDDLFELLPQSARRADGAPRSLRATVEWSDALLCEKERHLLRRMGVFAGGFDLTAIREVCASEDQTAAQVADLTARLVEKSLLLKQGGHGPYQLLETIRQYATEQLAAAGELDVMRDRHARFYLDVALQEAGATLAGPERPHLEVLCRMEDNTRVALERLLTIDPAAALELAASLNIYWWTQGKLREGITWLERGRSAVPDAPAELRATSLFCEAFLVAHDTDDWHAAADLIDIGIDAITDAAEPPLILGMLHCLRGECDIFNGDTQSGVLRAENGLAISSRYPGSWGHGFCLWNAAFARLKVGDTDTALALLMEMHELTSSGGYGIAEMVCDQSLGEIWELLGVLDKARFFWEEALRNRRELGALRTGYVHGSMPTGLLAVARVAIKQGDLDTAASLLREGLPLAEEIRDVETAAQMAELLRRTSQVEPAQRATLRPEGGVWRIEFNGTEVHVPDLKGFWHLRELVCRPGEFVPALALVGASANEPMPRGDTGPVLDREALRQYRRRLAELDDRLDDAGVRGDLQRQEQWTAERDALIAELKRATGLGGRPRRSGSPAEKARLNVTRTIRHAISELSTRAPELAAHLDESIVTGVSCCYEPRTPISWAT